MINKLLAALRNDGFQSTTLGYGTQNDRSLSLQPERYSKSYLRYLRGIYTNDSIAAKIVELLPKTALGRGWDLQAENAQQAREFKEWAEERYGLSGVLYELEITGRLAGRACLLPIIADGLVSDDPLVLDRVRDVLQFKVISEDGITEGPYDNDLESAEYGNPVWYDVRIEGRRVARETVRVHPSRLRFAYGDILPAVVQEDLGVDALPVLWRVLDMLLRYRAAEAGLGSAMSDANQTVYKVKNLMSALLQSGQENKLRARFHLMDQLRSSINSILLDADGEDFQRVKNDMAGLPESLDSLRQSISETAEMPMVLLFGMSPAGMNSTGESDMRMWYDRVTVYRENIMEKHLAWAIDLIAQDTEAPPLPENYEISWGSLWTPTAAEEAELRLKIAQHDSIYLGLGVTDTQAIAETRSQDRGWSLPLPEGAGAADTGLREVLTEQLRQSLNLNEEAPTLESDGNDASE